MKIQINRLCNQIKYKFITGLRTKLNLKKNY